MLIYYSVPKLIQITALFVKMCCDHLKLYNYTLAIYVFVDCWVLYICAYFMLVCNFVTVVH